MPKKTKSSIKGITSENRDDKERWLFQYTNKEGKQKKIIIGFVSQKDAEYDGVFLGRLYAYYLNPQPVDSQTLNWIKEKSQSYRDKLIKAEFIEPTKEDEYEHALTIGELTDKFMEFHKNSIYNTWKGLDQSRKRLVERFGREKKIVDITSTDIKHFENDIYKRYAEATASRHCGRFKEIFNWGIKEKLVTENIFADIKIGKMENKERQEEVFIDMFDKVISACRTPELRFAFFLARRCAFRVPSECNRWRWSYISFASKRVKVWDVKRQTTRIIPFFPFLHPFISELLHFHKCESFLKDIQKRKLSLEWESTEMISLIKERGDTYRKEMIQRFPKGEDWVFTEAFRKRGSRSNQIDKLFTKAGVSWDKPFINCRGTCESEWVQKYGLKAATDWTGNTVKVAQKHYLEISKETWDAATEESSEKDDVQLLKNLVGKYGLVKVREMLENAGSES